MKKLLIIPLILLTGCSVNFTPDDLDMGIKKCENNDGVGRYYSKTHRLNESASSLRVVCNNGMEFTYKP